MTYQELLNRGKSQITPGQEYTTKNIVKLQQLEHTSLAEKCQFLFGVDSLEGLFLKEKEFYAITRRSLPLDISALAVGRCALAIDVGKVEDILNSHLAYHYEEE